MSYRHHLPTLFCALLTFTSTQAIASTTGSVGSPKVTKGKTEIEARIGYSEADDSSSQDERLRTRVHIDHGFTDYYAGRIVLSQDKRKGDSYEHDSIKIENRFYLLKPEDYGFGFGMRANYTLKDGDKKADSAELGMYELVPIQEYELRMQQSFTHEVGEDSDDGIGAEIRFQVTRPIHANHKLGLESFHNFGNLDDDLDYDEQSHTFGPVLKGKIFGHYGYQTGYRVGISEAAPDHSVKFFLNRSF